jgi:sporulation protein YlmC with PRC-barrel domain
MNTRHILGACFACALAALSAGAPLSGQAAPAAPAATTVEVVKVPVAGKAILGVTVAETELVATGYRASKLLHQEVYNDKGEKIGKVDDLVMAPDGTLSAAIVNVGGFLGMGKHLVAIPLRQFAHVAPKAVLPNASKDQLKALPKFEYA